MGLCRSNSRITTLRSSTDNPRGRSTMRRGLVMSYKHTTFSWCGIRTKSGDCGICSPHVIWFGNEEAEIHSRILRTDRATLCFRSWWRNCFKGMFFLWIWSQSGNGRCGMEECGSRSFCRLSPNFYSALHSQTIHQNTPRRPFPAWHGGSYILSR